MPRNARCQRRTKETRVSVEIELDGAGTAQVDTGIGFFDHLLTSLAHHALLDLTISTEGDVEVDDHHTVEDTALCQGEALSAALGDRTGIHRFGEAIAQAAVDIGGRPYCVTALDLTTPHIGALTRRGLASIRPVIEELAAAEGLDAHRMAAAVRFEEPPASRRRNPPPADHPTHPNS